MLFAPSSYGQALLLLREDQMNDAVSTSTRSSAEVEQGAIVEAKLVTRVHDGLAAFRIELVVEDQVARVRRMSSQLLAHNWKLM